jgi:hypothetical protein
MARHQRSQSANGGDGGARVGVTPREENLLAQMAARTMSDPAAEPLTGAEIGERVSDDEDYGDAIEPLDDGARNGGGAGRPAH